MDHDGKKFHAVFYRKKYENRTKKINQQLFRKEEKNDTGKNVLEIFTSFQMFTGFSWKMKIQHKRKQYFIGGSGQSTVNIKGALRKIAESKFTRNLFILESLHGKSDVKIFKMNQFRTIWLRKFRGRMFKWNVMMMNDSIIYFVSNQKWFHHQSSLNEC